MPIEGIRFAGANGVMDQFERIVTLSFLALSGFVFLQLMAGARCHAIETLKLKQEGERRSQESVARNRGRPAADAATNEPAH